MLEMINNDWFQDGRTQGFADGRTQGFAEARARSLLDVLELRELVPTPELREHITSTNDPAVLDRWFQRALTAGSMDEIF